MRNVCLVANPRTGSNKICEVVSQTPGVRGKFDIFHHVNAWGVQPQEVRHINQLNGTDFEQVANSTQKSFTTFRRRQPVAFYSALRECARQEQAEVLFFKIFNNQLGDRKLELFFSAFDFDFIFLTRSLVDSYVSALKAQIVGTYTKTDTTEIKPKVSARKFLAYQDAAVSWYTQMYGIARRNSQPVIIRFEDMLRDGQFDSRRFEEAAGHLFAGALSSDQEGALGLQRQDLESDWRAKIANPEVIEKLDRKGRLREHPGDILRSLQ